MKECEKLEEDLMKAMTEIHPVHWPEIYCQFNSWTFPERLSGLKPDWWDKTDYLNAMLKYVVCRLIMRRIEDEVGEKECLKYANRDSMTPEEFEYWWVYERPVFMKKLRAIQ